MNKKLYSISCKNCEKDTGFATPNKEILTERGYNCSCGYSGISGEGIVKEINQDEWYSYNILGKVKLSI